MYRLRLQGLYSYLTRKKGEGEGAKGDEGDDGHGHHHRFQNDNDDKNYRTLSSSEGALHAGREREK